MKNIILQFFTWWSGQTLGTRLFTWRKGNRVGEDHLGNVYYRASDKDHQGAIRERRWVIYNGYADASAIPPGWHGWLHKRTDISPAEENYIPREWELDHVPNATGSPDAYKPAGSMAHYGAKVEPAVDYEAWHP
ncbi:MAG: NADH:ubiquinone oxidoreductase subunit NDUFA12 [Hyphomicrobiales bacterium]|nr:MAG: NADH:ubiquinone oxidoreductase subunit NDUFA12 [Hyphomicrobiales bacterium]